MDITAFQACRDELNNILMAKLAAGPKPPRSLPTPDSKEGPGLVGKGLKAAS